MSLKKLFLRGMSWSLLDKVVNQVGMFFITIYLARELGAESYGLIGMLTVFLLIAESLVNSGFSQALVQRSQKASEEDFSTIFIVNVSLACLIYSILFLLAPYIADFYHEPELKTIGRVLFLVILINSLSIVRRAKLIIKVDFKSQAFANTIGTVAGASSAVILVHLNYGYWALVAMTLIKSLFINIVLSFRCRWKPKLLFSTSSFKKLFNFGSFLLIAGILSTTLTNLYALLIGRFFSPLQVGYFTQSSNCTNNISGLVASLLQGVTYPILTSINEDRKRMVSVYRKLLQVTAFVSLPCMFGFAAIAKPFTLIFLGKSWAPMIPVLMILSFARSATPISTVNMNILNAVGRSDLFFKTDIVKIPINLTAILILIPFGIKAAAVAVLISVGISLFINTYYPKKLFQFGMLEQTKACWKYLIAASIMFILCSFPIFPMENIYSLLLQIVSGACIYPLTLIILKDSLIWEVIHTIKGKLKSKQKCVDNL